MTMRTANLSDRIAKVFSTPDAKSTDVEQILAEATAALTHQKEAAEKAEAAVLDPTLSSDQAAKEMAKVDRAKLEVRRLEVAVSKLSDLRKEREEAEIENACIARYEAAKARRDQASAKIRKVYPEIQRTLLGLISEIMEASNIVEAANHDLPRGAEILDKPEGHAFGYPQAHNRHVIGDPHPARIVEMLVPDLRNWKQPAWPPEWSSRAPGRLGQHELEPRWSKPAAELAAE